MQIIRVNCHLHICKSNGYFATCSIIVIWIAWFLTAMQQLVDMKYVFTHRIAPYVNVSDGTDHCALLSPGTELLNWVRRGVQWAFFFLPINAGFRCRAPRHHLGTTPRTRWVMSLLPCGYAHASLHQARAKLFWHCGFPICKTRLIKDYAPPPLAWPLKELFFFFLSLFVGL